MKRFAILSILILISLGCLWFTFRNVNFGEVMSMITSKASSWPWFLVSGMVMMMNIIFRGFRYHRILASVPEVSLKRCITITSIMFLGNSILPLRAGEAIRVYLPYRLYSIPLATSMAFHGADRLFDMIAMLVLLTLSLWFAGDTIAPAARTHPVEMFGHSYTFDGLVELAQGSSILILLVGLGGILAVCLIPEQLKRFMGFFSRPLGERWLRATNGFVDHLHSGIAVFRNPRDFILGEFWTFLLWWMVILNVQILSGVFGVDLTWAQAGMVVFLVAVAVSLPQAPGYVGPFHLGFQMSLSICFGVAIPTATAIAYLAHFFQIVPVILLGFICMSIEGISFSSFTEAQQTLEAEPIEDQA
ncbi:MAG: flippase-like domain-containing protein [Candidatus Omnitrophica bacterium]|nr:flippase-like domain-containing protein [Candidatus Omnitrophota bacterium]